MPLIPFAATLFPLLTAETTLFTVAKVFFGFLIVPLLPSNLLALTAFILAFTALEYFDAFLFMVDFTADLYVRQLPVLVLYGRQHPVPLPFRVERPLVVFPRQLNLDRPQTQRDSVGQAH